MIITVAETGSTNDDLRRHAEEGAPEGLWLRAKRQGSGRGRMGRAWVSPTGNLCASGLVRLQPDDPPPPTLALVAGLAVHDCVARWLPAGHHHLKWPNDLIAGDAKLAGILIERAGDAVIVGVGLNIAQAPVVPGRQTGCLADWLGVDTLDSAVVMEVLAACHETRLAQWRGGLAGTIADWCARAHPHGTTLSVTASDGAVLTGAFAGLNADGSLRLQCGEGPPIAIHAGDVALLPGA